VPILLRNNFSSGPDGATITTTNSGAGDDDAFAAVGRTGANSVTAYDLAPDRPTAEFVGELSTGAASGTATLAWATGGTSQIWMRMYGYFTVLPNNFSSPTIFYIEASTGARCGIIAVNSSGANEIIASNKNDTQTAITTAGITQGEWFRLEARFQFSTTIGNGQINFYADADSDVATDSVSFSGWDLASATAANFYFGYVLADSNLEALRLSGLEVNDTGFPGPLPFKQKAMPGYQPSPIAVHNDVF
jgi:hypothetical protein